MEYGPITEQEAERRQRCRPGHHDPKPSWPRGAAHQDQDQQCGGCETEHDENGSNNSQERSGKSRDISGEWLIHAHVASGPCPY